MLDYGYYNMDCVNGMKIFPDNYFALAIVDPPYGKGEDGGKKRGGYVKQKNGSKIFVQDGMESMKRKHGMISHLVPNTSMSFSEYHATRLFSE